MVSSSITAVPKSLTITLPVSSSKRFSNFRSLCTTWWESRNVKPFRRSMNHFTTFSACSMMGKWVNGVWLHEPNAFLCQLHLVHASTIWRNCRVQITPIVLLWCLLEARAQIRCIIPYSGKFSPG